MGIKGSRDGQFNQLHDIAVDPIGNFVYTLELANHRVQKFDNNGTFLTKWDFNYTGGAGADRRPHQLAVDSYGYVYLTDRGGSEVLKFNNNGTFMEKWGAYGSGAKQFVRPHGIAFDSKDYMYITDMGNSRVQKFDKNGTFILTWGSYGTGKDQFSGSIPGIAVDS